MIDIGYEGPGAAEFLECTEQLEELQWKKSDILAEVLDSFGTKAVREIARDHQNTASYFVGLAKTAKGIVKKDRYPSLSFSHHKVAFDAGDWKRWLKLASDNGWSLRQLKQAIAEASGKKGSPADAVRKASHAATAMKSAADESVGQKEAFEQVLDKATEAYRYVAGRAKNA